MFPMKTAGDQGIDRGTIVIVLVAKNQNRLVKGPEPAQSAFVPYSFPAGNESPTANWSSNKKNLLTIVDWLDWSRSENPEGENWGRASVTGAPAAGGQTALPKFASSPLDCYPRRKCFARAERKWASLRHHHRASQPTHGHPLLLT